MTQNDLDTSVLSVHVLHICLLRLRKPIHPFVGTFELV